MFKKLFSSNKTLKISNAEVEKAIDTVDGEKLGYSEEMLLYGGFQELNEYIFFEGLFVSTKNFKSKKGATITFKSKNGDFTLPSSIEEFECDYAKAIQRYVAQISFDITKKEIKRIEARDFQSVVLQWNKKEIEMTMQAK